jgi:hypothetical protein
MSQKFVNSVAPGIVFKGRDGRAAPSSPETKVKGAPAMAKRNINFGKHGDLRRLMLALGDEDGAARPSLPGRVIRAAMTSPEIK